MKATLALRALLFLVVASIRVFADDKPTSLSDARAALLRTLLQLLALAQNSTLLFSSDSALFAQKYGVYHPCGSYLSLVGACEPHGRPPWLPFNFQLSTVNLLRLVPLNTSGILEGQK